MHGVRGRRLITASYLIFSRKFQKTSTFLSPYLTPSDDGISGTNTKKREDFNRMIEDCNTGKIDMIITKSISRFARNTLDCLRYIRELRDKNIPVFFEKENINTMDSKGEVLLTIMASLAQQESQLLSQNVKLGFQFRYQNGEMTINHNRFMGYKKTKMGI
ncbi:recombinase family protein [Eisenbergiella porci]|uniref:recombinase family protein n=1 Tax=Eisenbergiella porci TaxID=2652274 RepID=UPI002F426749